MSETLETTPVETVETPKQQLSEEQNALISYQTNLNQFIKLAHKFEGSKSQIVRAWTNSAISPMNKDELHFSYPEEQELFNLFEQVNSAKFVLMLYGMIKSGKIELKSPLMDIPNES